MVTPVEPTLKPLVIECDPEPTVTPFTIPAVVDPLFVTRRPSVTVTVPPAAVSALSRFKSAETMESVGEEAAWF